MKSNKQTLKQKKKAFSPFLMKLMLREEQGGRKSVKNGTSETARKAGLTDGRSNKLT